MRHRPPRPSLFPYTTLFRSSDEKRFDKAVRGSLRRVRAVGGDGLFTADTKEPNWSKAHNILLRSEEHTSELQSRRDIVCRLLLEKKNDRTAPTVSRHEHTHL